MASNKFHNRVGVFIVAAIEMVAGEKIVGTIVALSIAKKLTVYAAGRLYGFPRIYRRLARMTKAAVRSDAQSKNIRKSIQVTVM